MTVMSAGLTVSEPLAARLLADRHNIRGQRKIPMVLVEEYLDGQEISVEAFVFAGHTTVVAVTRKLLADPPVFTELGHAVPMELDCEVAAQCESMVRRVVSAIGYDFGAVHAELRLTASGPRLVEINGRLADDQITRLVLLATGVDMHGVLIDLYRGIAPPCTLRISARTRSCSQGTANGLPLVLWGHKP